MIPVPPSRPIGVPHRRRRQAFTAVATAAAMLLILIRFLPGTPIFFFDVLDEGWAWGVSIASAHGLVFGRDIVFNYGPYGAVATGIYEPGLRGMMVAGGAVLGLAFAAGLAALGRPGPMLLCALALPLVGSADALVFGLPLPAMLLCAAAARGGLKQPRIALSVLPLIPALGLLPLIKGSYLAVSLLAVVSLPILLWRVRERALAVAVPALGSAFLLAFWRAAGQPLLALPAFFAGTVDVIAGHNAAMAWPGPLGSAALAAGSAALLLAILAWHVRSGARLTAGVLVATAAGLAFVAFKAGYVRQDEGHEVITLAAIGLMLLIAASVLRGIPLAVAASCGLLLAALSSPGPVAATLLAGPLAGARADLRLVTDPVSVARVHRARLAQIDKLPWHPPGTADIYSWGQMRLFASSLPWSPRPMFQSYSAYTPALAAANAAHLRAPNAPDNIFFRPEPIDSRLAALEDGASWPDLLSLYAPAGYDGAADLIWLRRAATPAALPQRDLPPVSAELGEAIPLPPGPGALFAHIAVAPTRAGRLAGLLWRAPLLQIRLDFAGGVSRTFRFVPGMARAGFLISPYVGSSIDFLRVRAQPDTALTKPVAIAVQPAPGGSWAWQRRYGIALTTMDIPPATGTVAISGVARPRPIALPPPAPEAACVMDTADGVPVSAAPVPASWPTRLIGWAVFDRAARLQPETTDLAFQSSTGASFAIPTTPVARGDVADALHLPDAGRAGFVAVADLASLPPGLYAAFALTHRAGAAHACRTGLTLAVPPPRSAATP
jgi:hypothetical protein